MCYKLSLIEPGTGAPWVQSAQTFQVLSEPGQIDRQIVRQIDISQELHGYSQHTPSRYYQNLYRQIDQIDNQIDRYFTGAPWVQSAQTFQVLSEPGQIDRYIVRQIISQIDRKIYHRSTMGIVSANLPGTIRTWIDRQTYNWSTMGIVSTDLPGTIRTWIDRQIYSQIDNQLDRQKDISQKHHGYSQRKPSRYYQNLDRQIDI